MMHMYTLLSQPWFLLALSLTNAALLLVQLVLFVNFTRLRWDSLPRKGAHRRMRKKGTRRHMPKGRKRQRWRILSRGLSICK